MTPANPVSPAYPQAVAVVGSASHCGAQLLLHLESALPDCWFVTFDTQPLRWPISHVSAYRLERNDRKREVFSIDDIPDFMWDRAFDTAMEGRRITMADIDDFLQLESVEALIHVGSHYDGPDPQRFLNDTGRWVQAARLAGVRQFVYLSDYRVYGIRRGNPIPLTEYFASSPLPSHQILLDAEPDPESSGDLDVAVLRTAMAVGPSGSNPAAAELFQRRLPSDKNHNPQLQFLHEYDLARAAEAAVTQRLAGIYNLAGDGSISLRDALTLYQPNRRRTRHGDDSHHHDNLKPRQKAEGVTKYPMILSNTKFKQAGRFRFKYSSGQAFRAYCHSVLLEPN